MLGPPNGGSRRIVFGVLSTALIRCAEAIGRDDELRVQANELAGRDLSQRGELATLLIKDTLSSNPGATVLISSAKPEHLRRLAPP